MNSLIQQRPKEELESQSTNAPIAIQPTAAQIKQRIREQIQTLLNAAKALEIEPCVSTIRAGLTQIQLYCTSVGKTFIFVEEVVPCDRHELGGLPTETATLFRGPSTDASVAICIMRGALLYRNGGAWQNLSKEG